MNKGKFLMLIGLICLIVAGGIVIHNRMEDNAAGDEAQEMLDSLTAQIPDAGELSPESGEMPATTVDGHSYIGVITIPSIGIQLPIMQSWSKANARIAPCRYKGSVYDNDLIVAGHNYTRHFGYLNKLVSGDEVIITDVNGKSFYFEVVSTEIIDTYDVDAMDAGDWDLTVFTCTIGGRSRVTVRCEATGKTSNSYSEESLGWGFFN